MEGDVAANAADITALQGTSANHESRISSLETTSANLGTRMGTAETDIDTLQASDAQQASKISSLETTSADLGTRMGAAETDIDTLQASDAQQTSKISALEVDMNNVKPKVGQLESDVGTLETKVDQHTQSISGLSTEVNGLKTSKQDKLIAGSGITIDQNVISSTPTPYRRVIEGYEAVSNEMENFLVNARPGSTFEIYERVRRTGTNYDDWITVPPKNNVYRFGNMSVAGVEWRPRTPITMLSEYSYTDQDGKEFLAKTFAFYGYVYWSTEGSSTRPSKVGWIYFTRFQSVSSPNNFSVTMTPYAYNDSTANSNVRFFNGVLYRNITNTAEFENYIGIVNY